MFKAAVTEPPSSNRKADHRDIIAAWELGQLLNELRFRLQQNCLGLGDGHNAHIPDVFPRIRLQFRELASPRNFNDVDGKVNQAFSDWENTAGSTALAGAVARGFDVYRNGSQRGGRLPNGASELRFVEELTRQLSFIASSLEDHAVQLIKGDAHDSVYWAFELGKTADQIEYPPLHERAFDVSENIQGGREDPPFVLETKSSWPDDKWKSDIEFIARKFSESVGVEPPELQLDDATARREEVLRELSQSVTAAAQELIAGRAENAPSAVGTRDTPTPIETVDQDTERITEGHNARQAWETTTVGIEFHGGQLKARSNDLERTVESSLTFHVLRHIARNGENFTTSNELLEHWREYGGRRDGDSSLNSRLTDVRRALRQLGYTLQNRTNTGWRIVPRR